MQVDLWGAGKVETAGGRMWRVWNVERGARVVVDTFHTWKVWKVGRGGGGDVEGVEGGEGREHSDRNQHFVLCLLVSGRICANTALCLWQGGRSRAKLPIAFAEIFGLRRKF